MAQTVSDPIPAPPLVPDDDEEKEEADEEEEEEEECPVDPFSHKLALTQWDWIKVWIGTVVLLPIRAVLLLTACVLSWSVSSMALYGLSEYEKSFRPLMGWRKVLRDVSGFLGRVTFHLCSFHEVKTKGRRVSPAEAPVLVVAPHTTFFDGFTVFWSGMPYIVSRTENRNIPLLGKCIECVQALFVSREDPLSRQKTVQEIIRRSASSDEWSQLLIFPEGSTSNGQALMSFKPGAFYPGKPVQPVLIRYPNRLDTVTWTWNQTHGALKIMWLTMSQLFSQAELEFLPVYTPTDEEKADPKLFARNVRQVMAEALGVPTSNMTFEEVKALYGKKSRRKSRIKKD
ncbi:hypothetical protein TCAL_00227 [Tigriopus californicus]|uniref:Phospholipid/glycerol acyltransferase domain-containing protein n=1 Tax=Tigriopus californicus TaxID=6832 RepID=A0A553P1G2_TIGCA|nr:hypothetical protein TCAL_00227 [Tigriopus californicus]|eukprot:TCALIF_00227-PA protein Name:"Similar to CG32699 1-acylglycerophosphocholine O-acyltransferase 1 (Drosophila melanogaster)" AED:0.32 eAED:0.34 QI:0/-1/0/1/-1/1/1/0/342